MHDNTIQINCETMAYIFETWSVCRWGIKGLSIAIFWAHWPPGIKSGLQINFFSFLKKHQLFKQLLLKLFLLFESYSKIPKLTTPEPRKYFCGFFKENKSFQSWEMKLFASGFDWKLPGRWDPLLSNLLVAQDHRWASKSRILDFRGGSTVHEASKKFVCY